MTDIERIKELLPHLTLNGGEWNPYDAEFMVLCRNNIAALIEAIEKAPHGYRCTSDFSDLPNPEDCDCWKAEALGKRS